MQRSLSRTTPNLHTTLASLRDLVHHDPSPSVWDAIWSAITPHLTTQPEASGVLYAYLAQHLETWPDLLRSSPPALRAALSSQTTPHPLTLVRHLALCEGAWSSHYTTRLHRLAPEVAFTHLTASHLDDPAQLLTLLSAAPLSGLASLCVQHLPLQRIQTQALLRAMQSATPSLHTLTLSHGTCDDRALDVLCEQPQNARALTSLNVSHNPRLTTFPNHLLSAFSSLDTLSFASTSLHASRAPLLLAHPSLRALDLSDCNLTESSMFGLSPSLQTLNLSHNPLGDLGFLRLTAALQAHNLDLSDTALQSPQLRSTMPHLRALSIAQNPFDLRALHRLLFDLEAAPHLQQLDLSQNALPDETLRTLAESPTLSKIRILSLASNAFCDLGLAALVRSPAISSLESLDISSNARLRPNALLHLARSPFLNNLRHLNLRGLRLAPRPLQTLLDALTGSSHRVSIAVHSDVLGWDLHTPWNVWLDVDGSPAH